MATKKWKKTAYQIIRGNETDDPDVEANKEGGVLDEQENKRVKENGNNGVEVVAMKTLGNDQPTVTSSSKPSVDDDKNDKDGGNEENEPRIENGDTGDTTDNISVQSESLRNRISLANGIRSPNNTGVSTMLAKRKRQDSDIHLFAREGDLKKCSQLLSQPDVDVNIQGRKAMTALHLAAQNGHEEIISILLAKGANRYLKDSDDFLPLHYAAGNGFLECVKNLLKGCSSNDQQLNGRTKSGRTALMEAAESGCQDCCKELLGLNIDEVDSKNNTALFYAVKGGHKMIVDFLIRNKANPTNQNKLGITPLHVAASLKSTDCLELLFNYAQPDVLQVDNRGKNIIHFAVTEMSAECLKYILKHEFIKAYIDKWDGPVGTPLLYAISCRTMHCIKALLRKGASPSLGCKDTYPIHKAAEKGLHLACEQLLAKDKSILNQTNENKQTPLHMAAKSRHIETVNLICNKISFAQISPSAEDDTGQTALHIAVKKADEKIVRRLITGNIAVGKQDLRGQTALHLAAAMGKTRCCEILVEKASSNLHKYDINGYFPLDLAFQCMLRNHETIVYLLKESFGSKQPKQKSPKYAVNVMLLKCRLRKYMEKALNKKLRNIVDAIIESHFWEDAFFGGKSLHPENFKNLVTIYPDLAFKVQGKYIKVESTDQSIFGFTPFEDNYYMKDENSAFDDETGKLKSNALEHHKDVYSWAANHPVTLIINNNESELLKHPVTQAWLRNKWKSYIYYIHCILLMLDGIYLSALICFMATSWNWIHISNKFNITKDQFCETTSQMYHSGEIITESLVLDKSAEESIRIFEETVAPYTGFYYWVFITWIIKVLLEMFCATRLKLICLRFDMLPHVLIEISQLVLTMVLLFAPFGMCYNQRLGLLQEDLAWQCGIFAVLFAWLQLINCVNQALTSVFLPITKDFLEILLKVAYFLVTFIAIFAFIFHLLLLDQKAFVSVPQSIGSTLVWMLLDLGYGDTFVEEKLSYPILSNIIFFLFITTIGCLIVSLISKERTRKAKGKELDDDYKRLVIYAKLIFRFDMCFPFLRRKFAVNKYVDNQQNQTILENYLGKIESTESTEVTYENKEIVERINKLESIILDISDQMTYIRLQLTSKNP